jgi:hypothetical protein
VALGRPDGEDQNIAASPGPIRRQEWMRVEPVLCVAMRAVQRQPVSRLGAGDELFGAWRSSF